MHRYFIVLLATALLAYANDASAAITSKTTAADLPADIPPLLTANHNGDPTKRLLRDYRTTNADNEERVGLAGLIQAGTSKVDDLITSKKLAYLVSNLQLGDDLVASLRSSQLEELNKFVTKFNHNKNLENQFSLIAPLSAKYGDDAVARTLVELERNADTLTPTKTNLVKKLRSEQLTDWQKNGKSVDDVFNLLKLHSDDESPTDFTTIEEHREASLIRQRERLARTKDKFHWQFKRPWDLGKDQTASRVDQIHGRPFKAKMSTAGNFASEWDAVLGQKHIKVLGGTMGEHFDQFAAIQSSGS
ncbi:hypothetical protein JG688_00016519 [Phytophthora aleatoria]|uniref:RxLR effector protein n=1 Tax=Phytophthora aleatoria TaxID=2496075 RepID=A0A8J5IRX3_9STRA|nr:hypothetical protein JG688_00016519 [Phytophthora aleatoria]